MSKLCIFLLFIMSQKSQAILPIGLYEALMGNSGVAISDPMAASYYNPSLLQYKTKDAYNLSASSFDSFKADSEEFEMTSVSLNPGYLSSIIVGDALVHELFLVNMMPGEFYGHATFTSDSGTSFFDTNLSYKKFLFGYSMAFRSVPFALSYFGEYNQVRSFGFTEFISSNTPVRSTIKTRSDFNSLSLGISVSGHFKFDIYTLGMHYRSRQWRIYKKSEGAAVSYAYGTPTANDYTKTSFEYQSEASSLGQNISIGHGFRFGSIEFLTDSILFETEQLSYKFELNQSFGFRVTSDGGHQFLCGVQQSLKDVVKNFGDDTYYSVGYSWKTRELRSAVGIYYYNLSTESKLTAMGISFSSEFGY